MASGNSGDQQLITADRSTVVFATDHFLSLKKIKKVGRYTDADIKSGELRNVIGWLREIFHKQTLLKNGQEVIFRINNESIARRLTTESKLYTSFSKGELRDETLTFYPADYVRFMLGLLNTLREIAVYKNLQMLELAVFTEEYDVTYFRDNAKGAEVKDPDNEEQDYYFVISEPELLTQEGIANVEDLLEKIETAYAVIEKTFQKPEKEEKEEEKPESEKPETVQEAATAKVADFHLDEKTTQSDSGEGESTQTNDLKELTPDQTKQLQTGMAAVQGMAYEILVRQFLENAGLDERILPSEISLQLEELRRILTGEIYTVLQNLSADELAEFLKVGSFQERMAVLRKLLIRLYSNPANQFFVRLQEIYQACVQHIIETQSTAQARATIQRLDQLFTQLTTNGETSEANAELEKIRSQVKAWMAAFLAHIEQEEKAKTQTPLPEAQNLPEVLEEPVYPTPKVKFRFSPVQEQKLEQQLSYTNLMPVQQRQIQRQVANLVWASLVQHFNPDQIPPQILDLVSAHAITYISRLDADELASLATHFTRLSHHVGIFSVKIFEIPEFVEFKNKYDQTRTEQAVDRNKLINDEATVATKAIIDILFSKNDITDSSVPDENGLQTKFDNLKAYIQDEVNTKLFELTTQELIELTKDPQKWLEFFETLEDELSKDPQFRAFIREFLEKYVIYLIAHERVAEARKLEESFNDFRTNEGRLPGLSKAAAPAVTVVAPPEVGPVVSRVPVTQSAPTKEETPEGMVETSLPSIRKKRDILSTILKDKWDAIATEDKLLLYQHFGYPVPRNLLGPTADLQAIEQYCLAVPIELLELKPDSILLIRKSFEESKKKNGSNAKPISVAELQQIEADKNRVITLPPETKVAAEQYLTTEHTTILITVIQEQQQLDPDFVRELLENYQVEVAQNASIAAQIEALQANAAFVGDTQAMIAAGSLATVEAAEQAFATNTPARAGLFNQAAPNPYSALKAAFRNKVSPQGALKSAVSDNIQKRLLMMGTGIGTVAVTGLALLQNKQFRELVIGGLTAGVAGLMYGLSTLPGIATFLLTSATLFPLMGPLAFLPAILAADLASYLLPWGKMPWYNSIRMPPGPWSNVGSNGTRPGPSLAQMRGKAGVNGQTGEAGSGGKGSNAGIQNTVGNNPAGSSPAITAANQAAQLANAGGNGIGSALSNAASSAASSSVSFFGLGFGMFVPLLSLITVAIISITVLTVIMGAFLVPVPTHPSPSTAGPSGGQSTSKYLTVTKVATNDKGVVLGKQAEEVKNHTATDITYTITITPKIGYAIKVTNAKDVFSNVGGGATNFTSKITPSTFPTDPITPDKPFTTSYTINTGTSLEDTFLSNTVTLTFDVLDATGQTAQSTQTYLASANVYIGTPKVGCWPTDGVLFSLPFDPNVATHTHADAFDISKSTGIPIHAPFPGTVINEGRFDAGGYGNFLKLSFQYNFGGKNMPLTLIFGHMVQFASDFSAKGSYPVTAGQIIGYMGCTGNCTGPHLHYELVENRNHGLHDAPSLRDLIVGGQAADRGNWVQTCYH